MRSLLAMCCDRHDHAQADAHLAQYDAYSICIQAINMWMSENDSLDHARLSKLEWESLSRINSILKVRSAQGNS